MLKQCEIIFEITDSGQYLKKQSIQIKQLFKIWEQLGIRILAPSFLLMPPVSLVKHLSLFDLSHLSPGHSSLINTEIDQKTLHHSDAQYKI